MGGAKEEEGRDTTAGRNHEKYVIMACWPMIIMVTCLPLAVSKHTQLIQFSLLSSEITEGGWIVRPGSSTKYQTPKRQQDALKKERAGKKREDRLKKGVLLPKTVERLKQVSCYVRGGE